MFNKLREIWKRPSGRMAGRIMLLIAIISFVIFTPFFDGGKINVYSKFFGENILLEFKYPPVNENQIEVIYKNNGAKDLENLHITYTTALTSGGPFRTKEAELEEKYLLVGQSSKFYINISNIRNNACQLLKPDILARVYFDWQNEKCYFLISKKLEGFCAPGKINLTILTAKRVFYREYYYPLSVNHTKPNFYLSDGKIKCEEIFNHEDYAYLPYQTENITVQLLEEMGLGDIYKLSKKYCHEELMPPEWCVKNDLF